MTETGCGAGAVLVGHESVNRGLIIRVHNRRPTKGGYIDGPFDFIKAGGKYSYDLRELEGRTVKTVREVVDPIRKALELSRLTILERNMLRMATGEEEALAMRLHEERRKAAGTSHEAAASAEPENAVVVKPATADAPKGVPDDVLSDLRDHAPEYEHLPGYRTGCDRQESNRSGAVSKSPD